MTPYLVHIGYVLMLVALVARDVLWLRAMMVAAQGVLGGYAWLMKVPAITLWNSLFVAINLAWVIRILHERRAVQLPADLAALYERHFSAFTRAEFLRWWQTGRREQLCDRQLTWNGQRPEALFFLLGGRARVSRGGEAVVDLAPGQFVAEMSLITGDPANADVVTLGEADVVWWPTVDLRTMQTAQPALWARLQSVIGRDLVEKIRRGETRSA
ncbi:MAG: cyclic nucleotide-binding domain-containing protein [Acidobacteria bacterium]|nr:cyclic nucleotide-binding domain-containing protein [Acidobacteriota bacterium]